MDKLPQILQPQPGSNPATTGDLPVPSSRPDWQPPSPKQIAAGKAADRLFDLLPPLDVGDPKTFLAATAAIFSEYPQEVMDEAVFKIPRLTDRPTLRIITAVCDELYAPIERQAARELAAEQHRRGLPPPRAARTPEAQARIEAQIREARLRLGIPPEGLRPRPVLLPPSADMPITAAVPYSRNDGQHWRRVADDLEQRQARRVASSGEGA